MIRTFGLTVAIVAIGGAAHAQPGQQLPPDHPPIDDPHGQADPHGQGDPQGDDPAMDQLRRRMRRQLSTAEPSGEVPHGAVRVRVVDENDRPVAGQVVQLGIMRQDEGRDRSERRTGADGRVLFDRLPRGTSQAYRINVPYQGAVYSCTPFQLPMDQGYDVKIVRLPTTRDDRAVLQYVAETLIELRDDRAHVVYRTQLVNLGEETYVFPEEGKTIRLPEGFMAFQSERMMTDQRLDQVEDVGLKIRGSLPPGRVDLVWAYDLRISGSRLEFPVVVPWRTFIFVVASQAPRGLTLEARGMPPAEVNQETGDRLLVTQIRLSPDDPPLGRVDVVLGGIPGPGPWRWMAVGLALLIVIAGATSALVFVPARPNPTAALAKRKRELLDEVRTIEQLHASGEIGPTYRERRIEKVVVELAAVLRAQAEVARQKTAGTDRPTRKAH